MRGVSAPISADDVLSVLRSTAMLLLGTDAAHENETPLKFLHEMFHAPPRGVPFRQVGGLHKSTFFIRATGIPRLTFVSIPPALVLSV